VILWIRAAARCRGIRRRHGLSPGSLRGRPAQRVRPWIAEPDWRVPGDVAGHCEVDAAQRADSLQPRDIELLGEGAGQLDPGEGAGFTLIRVRSAPVSRFIGASASPSRAMSMTGRGVFLRGRAGDGLLGARDAEHRLRALVPSQPHDDLFCQRCGNEYLFAADSHPQAALKGRSASTKGLRAPGCAGNHWPRRRVCFGVHPVVSDGGFRLIRSAFVACQATSGHSIT
jgi:hypothetical protein